MMEQAFRFQPRVFERVWGGHALGRDYGRPVADTETRYGESWEISDRPEADSVVAEGPYEGMGLHELWTHKRRDLFGTGYDSCERFPLLCKILDAEEYLSVQVHPDSKAAALLGGEPKNEIWYIADAREDARIYAGFRDGVTMADVKEGVERKTLERMMVPYRLQRGDSFLIPAGLVHSIGPGNIIYEIQQNSDTTYRLYDWGREGRELHVDQSLKCLEGRSIHAEPRFAGTGILADTPWFVIEEVALHPGDAVPVADETRFAIVVVLEGALELPTGLCRPGDFILMPSHSLKLPAAEEARVLIVQCPVPES